MKSFILEGRDKKDKIIYQSRVYFDLIKIWDLKRKMIYQFGQRLSFYII